MAKVPYIDDGYTEDFVLPEGDFWPEVRGQFRPLTAPAWATFLSRAGKTAESHDLEASTALQIETLVAAIKKWDLLAPGGQLVGISKESFSKLRKKFLEALFEVTLGSAMGLKSGATDAGN
jgi:hypothetical protein